MMAQLQNRAIARIDFDNKQKTDEVYCGFELKIGHWQYCSILSLNLSSHVISNARN